MRFLIMGACGMAGHVIATYLLEKGHDVTGYARTESPVCKTIIGDVLQKERLDEIIQTGKYEIVVNCIGILNTKVDSDLATGIYINSFLPHYIAECCDKAGSKLIHISTDCVFSGKVGAYTEVSIPDETSFYGRTKFLGEVIDGKHLTLRTSIIGPELKENGVGLFHWFMKQQDNINGFANVWWSGVTTIQLAKIIEKSTQMNINGLYHLSNNQKISKYELLRLFNQYCREGKMTILRKEEPVNDKTLLCTRTDVTYQIPDYEMMVEEMSDWINGHQAIYKQYLGGI